MHSWSIWDCWTDTEDQRTMHHRIAVVKSSGSGFISLVRIPQKAAHAQDSWSFTIYHAHVPHQSVYKLARKRNKRRENHNVLAQKEIEPTHRDQHNWITKLQKSILARGYTKLQKSILEDIQNCKKRPERTWWSRWGGCEHESASGNALCTSGLGER